VSRPFVTCLTAVRDEAWILESFLRSASLWADRIIVADQGSRDGTREIAASFEKVHLIENPSKDLDQGMHQRLLIDEARRLADGPQIFFALDADEALSSNVFGGPTWSRVLTAQPGTVISFPWANLAPDGRRAWLTDDRAWGYVDDGALYEGGPIHAGRLPNPVGASTLLLDDCVMLHRQYLDWDRMKAKQRWYQAWECVNSPGRAGVDIYRQYHHMYAVPPERYTAIRPEWLSAYRHAQIDLTTASHEGGLQFDERVLQLFDECGVHRFRRMDIWEVDWKERAEAIGRSASVDLARDPRRPWDRAIHDWLQGTQMTANTQFVLYCDAILRRLHW
jgi:hypothetical protein